MTSYLLIKFDLYLYGLLVLYLRLVEYLLARFTRDHILVPVRPRAAKPSTRVLQSSNIVFATLIDLSWDMASEVRIIVFDAEASYIHLAVVSR
jgi:hypothetical protein